MDVWGECVWERRMNDCACVGEEKNDELHTKRKEGCEGEGGFMEPKPSLNCVLSVLLPP